MPSIAAAPTFTGFTHEAFQFLVDLTGNNDRSWFRAHKPDYEHLLKQPLEQLCVALDDRFKARGLPLHADPARSPFRIYRDIRFSKDKSPYKTNIGASFPWTGEGPATSPDAGPHGGSGGYFHLSPEWTFAGGGIRHLDQARLAAFRTAVMTEPDRVLEALDEPGFVRVFGSVTGDRLKRAPQGVPVDHPHLELLKLKDVLFWRQLSEDEVASPQLPDVLADMYAAGLPVLRFLARL